MHAFQDELKYAQRAVDHSAAAWTGIWIGARQASGGREDIRSGPAAMIPLQVFKRAVKQPLVSSELLERTHFAAGADDGDEIVWLQLLVHKLPYLPSRLGHTLE